MKKTSMGEGLPKSDLLLQFWAYRRYFLWRIQRRIFCPETAEDIFQEACIRFMTSGAVFPHPQHATRYFCRVIQSLIVEHAKRAIRLEYRAVLPELCCDPEAEWDQSMLLKSVNDAVEHLSTKDQHLLEVYLDPELGRLRDKCKILGLPNSTMRYRYQRITGKLRGMIEEKL